jgi:hypothetical protein
MHLNPSTNNKVGHLFQGDNHYCYTSLISTTKEINADPALFQAVSEMEIGGLNSGRNIQFPFWYVYRSGQMSHVYYIPSCDILSMEFC